MNLRKIRVALIGNPNTGKTSLFNLLTDSSQATGNWGGVTVEKKFNEFFYHDNEIEVIDLPGLYDISTSHNGTREQRTLTRLIIKEGFDLIINVIDAVNLERNLYLTTQLVDIRSPMIVALNFGDKVDEEHAQEMSSRISENLGVPTLIISTKKAMGIEELKNAIISPENMPRPNPYPKLIDDAISKIANYIANPKLRYFLALKGLEEKESGDLFIDHLIFYPAEDLSQSIEEGYQDNVEELTASTRLERVKHLMPMHSRAGQESKMEMFLDKLAFGKITGSLIFIAMMFLMFTFSINVGGIFQDPIELLSRAIFIDFPAYILHLINAPKLLSFILAAGIGGGITTVVAFIPVITGLFLFLSFLEESGYLSRAAVLVDGLLKKIGLPGSAFVPLIVSFGCNVPAIIATRVLESKEAQIKTALMAPFMSCSARLAVYALFCAAFFKDNAATVVFSLYMLGIVLAILTGFLLKFMLGNDVGQALVIELPRYQMPSLKHLFKKTYRRVHTFVFGAGRTIVIIFLIIQVLGGLSREGYIGNSQSQSFITEIGKSSITLFKPMGLHEEQWPLAVGLITGILAKEVVIGTLSAIYNQENMFNYPDKADLSYTLNSLSESWYALKRNISGFTLSKNFFELAEYEFENTRIASEASKDSLVHKLRENIQDKFAVIAYLIFILLYFPCIAVFGAIKHEIGTKWAVFSAIWSTSIAYCVAVLFYQIAIAL